MGLNEKISSIEPKHFKLILECGARYKGHELTPLIYFPYKTVKTEIPTLLIDGDYEKLFTILGVSIVMPIKDAMRVLLWVYDEVKTISKMEKDFLETPPDAKMVAAGIESLNELGDYNLIDHLVIEWGVYTHEQIESMPYHKIFDKQRKMKLDAEIQKNLVRMEKERNKRKY